MVEYIVGEIKKFPTASVTETLVEFTERKRVLVAGTSARPGPYRFSVTPYLREPAECLSEYSKINELAMMKGTQVGGTDGVMMNHELYCIEYGIGPVLYVTGDDDLAKDHMEKRVDPMIDAAGMSDKITPSVQKRSNKASGDTVRAKSFGGTFLRAVGPRSESKLRSLPGRIIHIDETDVFPVKLKGGGDTIEKAVRRADSYGQLKIIVYISTPKLKSESRIEPLFQQGDMRYYNIKCPKCGMMQRLEWKNVHWEKDDDGHLLIEYDDDGNVLHDPTWMECANEDCDRIFHNHEKVNLLAENGHGGDAEWIPTKKPDRPGFRSYHVNALYGFRSWLDIVIQWERIDGDQTLLQEFVNDVLGETYSSKVDKPDMHYLMSRAEPDWIRGQINERVKILHLGADVQKDRIECAIVGYTDRKEAWMIEYHVFQGVTNDPNDPCWNKLQDVIEREYEKDNGEKIWIQTALVDSPYEKPSVLSFCERFPYTQGSLMGVFPCYGRLNPSDIVKGFPSSIGVPELRLDDQKLKKEIYNRLRLHAPATGNNYPTGYMHFPSDYNEDYYKQMTAEDVIETTNDKGQLTVLIANAKQRRNEVLDCTKMTLGGLYYVYTQYFKLLNAARKLRKKREIVPDWGYFWSQFNSGEVA